MRKLKFRVWDKRYKSFLRLWDKEKFLYLSDSNEYPFYLGECLESNNFIVQQFTGLTDKNGKEIYEGDILKTLYNPFIDEQGRRNTNDFLLEIRWVDFTYELFSRGKPHWLGMRHLTKEWQEIKVVGNIYETPEMLNV